MKMSNFYGTLTPNYDSDYNQTFNLLFFKDFFVGKCLYSRAYL